MCYRFTTPLRRRPAHGNASPQSGNAPCVRRSKGKNGGIGCFPIPPFVGWVKGLEPSTPGTTIRCSNQLSYTHHRENGTPEGTRTPGLLLRRQLLYPTELLAHMTWNPQPFSLERVKGIEPSYPAWKAGVLPLNYTRKPENYNTLSARLSSGQIAFFSNLPPLARRASRSVRQKGVIFGKGEQNCTIRPSDA